MKVRCNYCKAYISDTDEKCSNCGAINQNLKRFGNDVPLTLEELKQWYIRNSIPNENVTRFYIGKNIKSPKAFGIYYDTDSCNYIVYKNKDNGERIIRYEGKDEQYAVCEFYMKLKVELASRNKFLNETSRLQNRNVEEPKPSFDYLKIILAIAFLLILLVMGAIESLI